MVQILLYLIIIIFIYQLTLINIETFNQQMITKCSNIDNNCYKIQQKYNKETHGGAADLLAIINKKNEKLIEYLKNKYIVNGAYTKIGMTEEQFNKRKKMTHNLIKRYNYSALREHNPNGIENTSYVWKKGQEIGYCLRERNTGNNNFHNIDILFFVNLHEISHLAATEYDPGHKIKFWKYFKIILQEAEQAGLYNPINYYNIPDEYCGLDIKYNPLFDNNL